MKTFAGFRTFLEKYEADDKGHSDTLAGMERELAGGNAKAFAAALKAQVDVPANTNIGGVDVKMMAFAPKINTHGVRMKAIDVDGQAYKNGRKINNNKAKDALRNQHIKRNGKGGYVDFLNRPWAGALQAAAGGAAPGGAAPPPM